ncbi:nuclear transport factor 2 family protein [Vineibacter terrae]|uniref:nuclear transport factor 2 family protein n=1 Tax=Vineibacter terrae TaxID=2586908 RepID=UPI002E33CEDD|nr:nuclear transport factor 2 family protein [Vineibacter terrae]HEX2885680.1 nuclear transport factor 2 family protein [Vineibacter terrae]
MTRRHMVVAGAFVLTTSSLLPARRPVAQPSDEAAVNQAVEALRQAMLAGDRAQLEALVAHQLSYGHSGGVVETKAQFIDVIASRKTVYKTITLSDAAVTVAGSNAIARHAFAAEVESDGKADADRIGVMQVWQKQGASWKLLARQAFKS